MTEVSTHPKKPLLLMILDGWGLREAAEDNAVANAHTPNLDHLTEAYPWTSIGTSGLDVGLPPGQMGNSEVGHQNLGAGRIVYQDFTRITKAIETGEFQENREFIRSMDTVLQQGTSLHLIGLLSDGGVHSHMDHLMALLKLARKRKLTRVWVHAILDGRDTSPTSGVTYLRMIEEFQEMIGCGKIVSVMGRYYAMDRDNRWDRIEKAFRTMVHGGPSMNSAQEAIKNAYHNGETDEFVKPVSILQNNGPPVTVENGDAVIFFNFRADRAREITQAFTQKDFDGFPVTQPNLASYVCMTEYDETFALPLAFPPLTLKNIFPEIISRHGLKQLRIAETEKYAHVTFFFNGGEEQTFPGEERILIPSPRDVPTYDHRPEMSAFLVTDEVVRQIQEDTFDVIILNFANGDMVGHTGIYNAAVRAVEAVDVCIGRITKALQQKDGLLLITSDHGNAEKMINPDTQEPFTAHTSNPVPFIITMKDIRLREKGILADISPTMLHLLGLPQPPEMTGKNLIL